MWTYQDDITAKSAGDIEKFLPSKWQLYVLKYHIIQMIRNFVVLIKWESNISALSYTTGRCPHKMPMRSATKNAKKCHRFLPSQAKSQVSRQYEYKFQSWTHLVNPGLVLVYVQYGLMSNSTLYRLFWRQFHRLDDSTNSVIALLMNEVRHFATPCRPCYKPI